MTQTIEALRAKARTGYRWTSRDQKDLIDRIGTGGGGGGVDGEDGKTYRFVFRSSPTQPITPPKLNRNFESGLPNNWSSRPPTTLESREDVLWLSVAVYDPNAPESITTWSHPVRMTGHNGQDGRDQVVMLSGALGSYTATDNQRTSSLLSSVVGGREDQLLGCLLYTSPSPRDS